MSYEHSQKQILFGTATVDVFVYTTFSKRLTHIEWILRTNEHLD